MSVQIDRMETSVEIKPTPTDRRAAAAATPEPPAPLRDVLGAVVADELDRFLRARGL
jgi:hypothetical protein